MPPLLPPPDPIIFAREWAKNWNAHDIEAVLAHFSDDVEFTSPTAAQVEPASDGIVYGKAALRSYWQKALALNPRAHFKVSAVFAGVDTVLIRFRTESGRDRLEVLRFRNGRVFEGHGTDAVDPAGNH